MRANFPLIFPVAVPFSMAQHECDRFPKIRANVRPHPGPLPRERGRDEFQRKLQRLSPRTEALDRALVTMRSQESILREEFVRASFADIACRTYRTYERGETLPILRSALSALALPGGEGWGEGELS